ncbi:MAG: hypothetical protein PHT84_06440 [Candidatus Pacebacteria bacterium]|nr:hypothetical protein [Candidatus Paceibacterota bacterium]
MPLFHATGDQISKIYTKEEIEKKLMSTLDKKEKFSHFIKSVYPEEINAQKESSDIGAKLVEQDLKAFKDDLSVVVD